MKDEAENNSRLISLTISKDKNECMCQTGKKMVLPHKHMPKAYLRLRMFEMWRLGDFVFRMKLRGR